MDFAADGGPDFGGFDPRPFMFGADAPAARSAVHDRVTSAWRGSMGEPLAPRCRRVLAAAGCARSASWRGSASLNKVMLSPEGNTLDEMKALTRALLARRRPDVRADVPQSVSLKPGCTPYVRTASRAATQFLDRDRRVLRLLSSATLGGVASTPTDSSHDCVRTRAAAREPLVR